MTTRSWQWNFYLNVAYSLVAGMKRFRATWPLTVTRVCVDVAARAAAANPPLGAPLIFRANIQSQKPTNRFDVLERNAKPHWLMVEHEGERTVDLLDLSDRTVLARLSELVQLIRSWTRQPAALCRSLR